MWKYVKMYKSMLVWKCVNIEHVIFSSQTILPLENLYIFFCPFKSFLVTQSNFKKWRGATPPSGMVSFSTSSLAYAQQTRLTRLVNFIQCGMCQSWANNSVVKLYLNSWYRVVIFLFGKYNRIYLYSHDFPNLNVIRIRIWLKFENRIVCISPKVKNWNFLLC